MTPNTRKYDVEILGHALSAVLVDVKAMTGKKAIVAVLNLECCLVPCENHYIHFLLSEYLVKQVA